MKKLITLIPPEHAKIGYQFIHYGTVDECEDCDFKMVCIDNLEEGRKYEVIGLKEMEHECELYGKVNVVEVKESDHLLAINPKYAFIGSSIHFVLPDCLNVFCQNSKICNPEGIKENDKCEIVDALAKIDCEKGYDLQTIKVRRVVK
ncbi:MAG: UPF0179 family protein [Candidatus Hydrothermarchaeales archaeon]